MKFFLYLSVVMILVVSSESYAENAQNHFISYGELLSKHTLKSNKDGIDTALVDYNSWSKDLLHNKALHKLQTFNPDALLGREKMAFWINAYNLLTIDLIIKTGEKETIKNQGGLFKNVWKNHDWKINNKSYTLDKIEHQILRPMGDSRIHMAINCASLSCPDLRVEPYDEEKLDTQLEEQAKLFVINNSKGVKITDSGLKVSKIFDWFSKDFGGEKGVVDFINKHLPATRTKNIAEYLDYNWSLNSK